MSYAFTPAQPPAAAIDGSNMRFPVHRIYCVGRNYAEHAREMGSDPTREAPFFFLKPADALVLSGDPIAYPARTQNFHHEVELVVAIGTGGKNISAAHALDHVFGYGVGNDLTRRDLQADAKKHARPWDTSKGFDQSAALAPLQRIDSTHTHPQRGRIALTVNGQLRQEADIADLIWSVPEIIAELSTFFTLQPGDLIYTGTPAGVSALKIGDQIEATIDGLPTLRNTIVAATNA